MGRIRWLEDGSGYTALEPAEGGGRDIVRHDPATGGREVLVPASTLIPAGASRPLGIADYDWSDDGTALIVFTNTRRVWRQNTRGDYWVLDRESGALAQARRRVSTPPTWFQFAKFDPQM